MRWGPRTGRVENGDHAPALRRPAGAWPAAKALAWRARSRPLAQERKKWQLFHAPPVEEKRKKRKEKEKREREREREREKERKEGERERKEREKREKREGEEKEKRRNMRAGQAAAQAGQAFKKYWHCRCGVFS